MREIPPAHECYKRTRVMSEIPPGLRRCHTTRAGVWGRVRVFRGQVLYVIDVEPEERHVLDIDHSGIIEPEVEHHLEPLGVAEFQVEFFRQVPAAADE